MATNYLLYNETDEFINDKFYFVITICDNATENSPVFLGGGEHAV